MLKKIVKYGNSNAIILDRAILELLNMREGSIVKLHTDGKSLIVTPELQSPATTPSMTGLDKVHEYVQEYKNSALLADKNQQFTANPNYEKFQEAVKEVMDKHQNALSGYDQEAFLRAVDTLSAEKYPGNTSSPAFIEEVKALQAQYSPGVVTMQKELADIAKKFGY